MKTATITREKQYPTPGKNFRLGWRYLYTVDFGEVLPQVGQRTATHDTLSSAVNSCKRLGFTPVKNF